MQADVELIGSSGGVFEVTLDGKPFYSKKQTGEFPNENVLVEEILKTRSHGPGTRDR